VKGLQVFITEAKKAETVREFLSLALDDGIKETGRRAEPSDATW
jgi:hypothetical protein